ncbi:MULTISPECIES: hypothetical protein [unclassified Mesorhizobium]|uniref:hypothetical protein n=1 Tax=unclassified Mesorhizobium TaxID=325217 RepID=UPI0015E3A1A2|nr:MULTISPECIES: hypothetical protein [unclassified Mesorhizobium]MBZ9696486.1 hypothetical protein [Mesorhizobium sp. CO1-1-9]
MASEALLGLLGHTESCIALIKAGPIASCDCRTAHVEDPAMAVEVTRHYARTAIATGTPIPTVILELLTCHVMDANPPCIELAEWLDAAGLLDLPPQANNHQGAVGRGNDRKDWKMKKRRIPRFSRQHRNTKTRAVEAAGDSGISAERAADAVGSADSFIGDALLLRSLQLQFRMSVHESAHAVARLHLDLGTIVKITIEAPEGGYVTGAMPGEQTEAVLTGVLIAALAGRAAEEVIVGSVAAGSGSESCDLAAATALAFDMETVMGFSKKWPLLYRKVEDRTLLLATDHDLAARVNARLESAYAAARKMVVNQEIAIDFLGEILLGRKTLEGPELDAVLQQVKQRIVATPE